MILTERFFKFFGGGVLLSITPLVIAVIGEEHRSWEDVLYNGPLVIVAVSLAAAALLEAGFAEVKAIGRPWPLLKMLALVCAALVVLGGAMLYQQYSDNDVHQARFLAGVPGVDDPPDPTRVTLNSYLVTFGALLAGLGSTLVAARADKA